MDIKIGVGRRITIPANLFETTNFKEGDTLDLQYIDGKFIIGPKNEQHLVQDVTEPEPVHIESKPQYQNSTSNFSRKIVSNLEEGQKYSVKYYSPCKLVIRTKNRYLNQFCEQCQGQLLDQGYEDNGQCTYRCCKQEKSNEDKHIANDIIEQKNPVKNEPDVKLVHNKPHKVIENIKQNVEKVQHKIDKEIEIVEKQQDPYISDLDKRVIQPVTIRRGYRKCSECGELIKRGFMLSDSLYCKRCAITDFKNYYKIIKK